MYKKSEIPGNELKNFQNVFKMLTMLVLLGGGPTPFLYTHLVYIWQKSDGHVH